MSEPTQEQKRWLDIIKNESYKIGHLAGFKDLTSLHHKWFKKMLFNKDTYVLKAHRGSYKCMNPETQVMMADYSNKAIKDIQIGEYVMGWDGTPRKVLDKHSGRSPMYRVTLNKNGEYYECNNNHILSLYSETPLADLENYFFQNYKGGYLYNIEIEDFLRFEKKKDLKHFKVNKTFNEVIPFDFSIISIDTGDFVGIVVEGDGMFLLDNFLVVHNTSVLELYIATTMILFPNKTILFVRKTDDDVKEVIKKVGDILKTPVFQQMGMVLNGIPLEIVKNTAFAIETNYRTTKTIGLESQLLGVGLKSSLTGKHAHIIIVDDIVNTEDRRSRVEREYTKQVWYELNSNIKMPTGTVISTGTTWHVDDAFSVMPPAEIYTCYETGLLSDDQINKIKSQMPPALFAANYELRFVASEDCMFYTPAIVDELDYFDEENKVTYFDLLKNGICFLDAGYGGSDYTAFVTMNRISGTDDYIAYGRCWRKHVNDCIPDIENIIKKYHLGTLKLENNGDKGYLAREFKYRGIRVATYHERMNKYTKISTYLYRLWKNIKWTKQTDEIFIGQILDYTEMAEHDDCADVTANASRFYIGGCKVVTMNGINI